jgi:hypothetical protein
MELVLVLEREPGLAFVLECASLGFCEMRCFEVCLIPYTLMEKASTPCQDESIWGARKIFYLLHAVQRSRLNHIFEKLEYTIVGQLHMNLAIT